MRKLFLAAGMLLASTQLFAQTVPPAPQQDTVPYYETFNNGFYRTPWNQPVNTGALPQGAAGLVTIIEDCGPFRVHYDNSGIGFTHPTNGPAFRAVMCSVLTYVSSVIEIPASAAPLDIDVKSEFNITRTYIAYANAYANTQYINGVPGFYGGLLYDHIKTGADPDPTLHDAFIGVDFNNLKELGTQCDIDLFTVLLHEITHTLGFSSNIGRSNADSTLAVSKANQQASGPFTLWDKHFLYRKNGAIFTKLVQPNASITPGITGDDLKGDSIWLTNSTDKSNLPIYAENPYRGGSSLSHFSDDYGFGFCHDSPGFTPHYSMIATARQGISRKQWTPQEIRVLNTLGYTIKAPFAPLLPNRSPYVIGNMIGKKITFTFAYDETGTDLNPALTLPSITSCQTFELDLGARGELRDLDGDPIKIFPNSLHNIRGCGNGGNNHNQLTVIPGGGTGGADKILYRPRPNFVGRAQFGLHLYDGKERGAYVAYTIIVTRDNNCFNGNNGDLIINGDLEEGQEVTTPTNNVETNLLFGTNVLRVKTAYGKTNFLVPHADGFYLNMVSVDYVINNSFQLCKYGSEYYALTNPPQNAPLLKERYFKSVPLETMYIQLTEPLIKCQEYKLEFDFNALSYTNMFNNDSVVIGVYSTNVYAGSTKTLKTIVLKNFTHNQWQKVQATFTYDFTDPDEILVIGPMFNSVQMFFCWDNFSLRKSSSTFSVSVTSTNPSCKNNNDGTATVNITNGSAPFSYKWSNGATTQKVNNLSAGTYTVTVTDASACNGKTASIALVNPSNPCVGCTGTVYDMVLGSLGRTDTIDAGGSTITYTGNVHVKDHIVLRNGTFNIPSGTVFYMQGHSRGDEYSPYIFMDNATLNINGNAKLTAACDTMWGGIKAAVGGITYNKPYSNAVNIIGTGTDSVEISHCSTGLETFSRFRNGTVAQLSQFIVVQARFKNVLNGVFSFKSYKGGPKDFVGRCSFYMDPALNKFPLNSSTTFMNRPLHNSGIVDNVEYAGNKIGPAYTGIIVGGETSRFSISNNIINDPVMAGIYLDVYSQGGIPDTVRLTGNTVNFGNNSFRGEVYGMFISDYGFKATGNRFFGKPVPNVEQIGIVHSVAVDRNGINIRGNTFQNLTLGMQNLNFNSQNKALIFENTFTGLLFGIHTDKNTLAGTIPPEVQVHCNNFTLGTVSGSANAIYIGGDGQFDEQGDCILGNGVPPAGNKFTGFNTAPHSALNSANGNTEGELIYNKSNGESANPNWGRITGNVTPNNNCGASGCNGTFGQLVAPVKPTLLEATLAIEQLRNRVRVAVQKEVELIRTVIRYYSEECTSPQYESTINQMLPNNLAAYNALAWDYATCLMLNQENREAIRVMNEIAYNNPGNVAIQQRTNFYTAYLNITERSQDVGYRATAEDLDVLAQVAASGTDFSGRACITLTGLTGGVYGGNCFSLPPQTANRKAAKESQLIEDLSNAVAFANTPNPFSDFTTVAYYLGGNITDAVLKVYDIQGRQIKSIPLNVTETRVEVRAEEFEAAGVYIYTIEANGIPASSKGRMVVVK
jgi:hypothetical protein